MDVVDWWTCIFSDLLHKSCDGGWLVYVIVYIKFGFKVFIWLLHLEVFEVIAVNIV
jgi:hypothetical protein